MKPAYNKLLPFTFIIILTGCSIPGSHLSVANKQLVEVNTAQLTTEQINVYSLSPSFVAKYSANHSGIVHAKTNPKLDKQIAQYRYRVGPGDVLNITIWDHPELTIPAGSYRNAQEAGNWVHANGQIFYPYIGFLYVGGKTVVEIREKIAFRLAKFIEAPQVDVSLAAFRSQKAYLTGEINMPGKQPITNVPLTLLDAINQGGGLTANADWRNVSITRNGKTEIISLYNLMQKGDLTENRLMGAGDIIHVPRNDSLKVFVLGEVITPNMLKIDRSGMTLTEALSAVGGINELRADATGIFVIRSATRDAKNKAFLDKFKAPEKKPSNTKNIANIYQLDINDASALMTGTEFELEAYDVLYVTAEPISRWNRVIGQILPTISAFNQLTGGILNVKEY